MKKHWIWIVVAVYLFLAYEKGYWPFAGQGTGVSSFSLTSF